MTSESYEGDERPAKPKVTVGGEVVKKEEHAVVSESGGGWRASEVLSVDVGMSDEAEAAGGQAVKEAVQEDRYGSGARSPVRQSKVPLTPLGQPFAIFKHPSEFTEQEDAVIVNGLLAQLPLYMIADKLRCSRTLLSNHIKESKLLSQVVVDRNEGFLDHVEWQAKRLIDSGNPAMIMFTLERKGKDRGWGQNPVSEVDMDDTRIVIGEIPEDEVEAAEKKVKEIEAAEGVAGAGSTASQGVEVAGAAKGEDTESPTKNGGSTKLPSPMEMALMEEAAKKAAEEAQRERDANTVSIPPEDVRVEPAPWDDGYDGGDPFGGGGGFGGGGFDGFM